jgi:hypothetical protein
VLSTGAFELELRSGQVSRTTDMAAGFASGSAGVFKIEDGGRLDIAGAATTLFMGLVSVNGGSGTVNVFDGGTLQVQKAVEVLDGTFFLADGAIYDGTLQDELVIADNGTLAFEIDAAADTYLTIPGQSLAVELGDTSTLDLSFSSPPTTGQSFTLISGVSGYGGVNSLGFQSGTGVFGNVNATGLDAGQAVQVDYNATQLVATIVAASIPGDTDGDGDVDDADLGVAFSNYTGPLAPNTGGKTAADGDADGDGDVDDADLGAAFAAYTGPLASAAVPEPTSLALLGLGGLAIIRRRRA